MEERWKGPYLRFRKQGLPRETGKTGESQKEHPMRKNETIGGHKAAAGIYWNKGSWNLVTLSGEGGVLPGNEKNEYMRIPTLAMVVLAPLLGASYVVFLPFIGFAMVADYMAKRAGAGAKSGAVALAATLSPEWRPGEAYFLGRRKKGAKGKAAPKSTDEPTKLEKEIEAKREGKK